MILLIDNYDSFTYNIVQAFSAFDEVRVARNDEITLAQIAAQKPHYLVIGPGPKGPKDAGISLSVIKEFAGKIPILGICLGHQAILEAFGAKIINAQNIMHGKIEPLTHSGRGLFRGIAQNTPIVRYHSLAGKKETIPSCFEISATAPDGEIMAVEHKEFHLCGFQFHPESIGTRDGAKMLGNFLHYFRDFIPIKELLAKVKNSAISALCTKKDQIESANSANNFGLSFEEAKGLMDELTEGNMSQAQIASLLSSLEIKGANEFELAGFASVLKAKAAKFSVESAFKTHHSPRSEEYKKSDSIESDTKKRKNPILFDIVGTGGGAAKTFNVSSTCALLLGAYGKDGGFCVLKHGNKAITSKSGAADFLSALGIESFMPIANAQKAFDKLGISFLHAQRFHSAMRFAAPVRADLGFKTAFNLLGPLSNPTPTTHGLYGVFSPQYTELMARAFLVLGTKRALVVSGLDGLDEISLCAPSQISELKNNEIKTYIFNPQSIGLDFVPHERVRGGGALENAKIAQDIFSGKIRPKEDPKATLVALNMGAALYVLECADSIADGFKLACEIIAKGEVCELIKRLSEISYEKL